MKTVIENISNFIIKTNTTGILLVLMGISLFLSLMIPGRTFLSLLFLLIFILLSSLLVVRYHSEIKGYLKKPGLTGHLNLLSSILLLFGILVTLNVIASKQRIKIDLTSSRNYTLSKQTKEILKRMDTPVEIIFFRTPASLNDSVMDVLKLYKKHSKFISVREYDPEENPMVAQQYNIKPVESQEQTIYSTIILLSGNRIERVQGISILYSQTETGFKEDLKVPPALERKITSSFLRLKESPRKIYFTAGHDEADVTSTEKTGLSRLKNYLIQENYNIDLLYTASVPEIPDDCSLLICWGPRKNFSDFELRLIDEFLKKGGRAIMAGDPQRTGSWNILLEKWGLRIENNLIIDTESSYWYQVNIPYVKQYAYSPLVDKLNAATFFPDAASLTVTSIPGIRTRSIIESSKHSWGETDFTSDSPVFEKGTDFQGPLTIMASANIILTNENEKKEEAINLVVFGDSDFTRNGVIEIAGNLDLFINAANYLADRKEMMSIRSKDQFLSMLHIGPFWMNFIFYSFIILIPILIVIFGIIRIGKKTR